jgi:chromatin structure-remodeling complex protein RSC7
MKISGSSKATASAVATTSRRSPPSEPPSEQSGGENGEDADGAEQSEDKDGEDGEEEAEEDEEEQEGDDSDNENENDDAAGRAPSEDNAPAENAPLTRGRGRARARGRGAAGTMGPPRARGRPRGSGRGRGRGRGSRGGGGALTIRLPRMVGEDTSGDAMADEGGATGGEAATPGEIGDGSDAGGEKEKEEPLGGGKPFRKIQGKVYIIENDEFVTDDDPKGNTKIDKNGVLLSGTPHLSLCPSPSIQC